MNISLQTFFSELFLADSYSSLWPSSLVWLNMIADLLIFLAYCSIPIQLMYVLKKRDDIPVDWVIGLIGGFIGICGIGYLMDIWVIWYPIAWLVSLEKVFTAAISITTVIVLFTLIPQILAIPSPGKLFIANRKLEAEIQERQEAEVALQQSQAMLQLVIDTFPQRIFWKDRHGYYLGCNRVFAGDAGFSSPVDVIGKDDFAMAWSDLANCYRTEDQQIIVTQKPKLNIEEYRIDKEGKESWIRVNMLPLRNEKHEVIGLLGSYEDITEYKQAEIQIREAKIKAEVALKNFQKAQNQLIQAEKMSSLGQLVAGVAHEINNPVNFIYGNLNHIQNYSTDLLDLVALYQQYYPNPDVKIRDRMDAIELDFLSEDLPKILSSIQIGADRIRQIVLSLRNFSRLDQSEIKAVNIHEGLDSTLLILQHRLKGSAHRPTIDVITSYAPLPLVDCYAGQLNQVFMNLLSNAIDALEEKYQMHGDILNSTNSHQGISTAELSPPTITIQTTQIDTQTLQITIADNGTGIPETVRSRLFDPFFTTKPTGKGTGLGLSISYQIIVEKHGGRLDCESTPGQGTEFRIQLPFYPQSGEKGQPLKAPLPS